MEILESGEYGPDHIFHHHNGYSSGHDEPMFACGYHWTYWPNLVFAQKKGR